MNNKLTNYEEEIYMNWMMSISSKVEDSLNRPLIVRREETNTLRVNFSFDLSSLLKEVGYIKKEFDYREYPEEAGALFERENTFREYTRSLDVTVDNYNRLKTSTQKVEYDLIADELKEIDIQLERAEHALNWNSEGIWNYIESLRSTVTDLSKRVAKAQQNVEDIAKLMKSWKGKPLYTRVENSEVKEQLLDVQGMCYYIIIPLCQIKFQI